MGKINGCLKCLFIFFNVVFLIFGCLLIYGAVKAQSLFDDGPQISAAGVPGMGWTWVFAIGVLSLSVLGIVTACMEKELLLKIFGGFMAAGMIIMLIFGIVVVVKRNQFNSAFREATSEFGKELLKSEANREGLMKSQKEGKCCGLGGVSDWGNEIPESCECVEGYSDAMRCQNKPQGTKGPARIYSQGCGFQFMVIFDLVFQVAMGLCFGFAVTALMGLLISLLMIWQVRKCDSSGQSIAMKGY